MQKRQIIAAMIEIANDLDNESLYSEADAITKLAQNYSQWSGDGNEDDYAGDMGMGGADDWQNQQNIQNVDNFHQGIADDMAGVPNDVPIDPMADRHNVEQFVRRLRKSRNPIQVDETSVSGFDPQNEYPMDDNDSGPFAGQ